MTEVRLQKVIAASGKASRREAEGWITAGRVRVNGEVVTRLGTKVDPASDRIEVDGEPVQAVDEKIYLMLYKPRSVVSTLSDPQGRTTLLDVLKDGFSARGARRIFHVGRLDYPSEGLLLLTNDGPWAQRLAHPRNMVPRTYHVCVRGSPGRSELQRLTGGVELEDGHARAVSADVLRRNDRSTWLEITVVEGRKRLVRRMLQALGHPVQRLIRVGFGGIELGGMKPGEVRPLTGGELKMLRRWKHSSRGRERPATARERT